MAQLGRDVMTPNAVALPATASLVEAALAMRDFHLGDMLILDNGKVCGIVTDRDIVVRGIAGGNYPATVKLAEICSRDLTRLSPTDSVEDAVSRWCQGRPAGRHEKCSPQNSYTLLKVGESCDDLVPFETMG